MADVPIKGSDSNTYVIDTDNVGGVETQVVKQRFGSANEDQGFVSQQNRYPVEDSSSWVLRLLAKVFGRFSFDSSSRLSVYATLGAGTQAIGTISSSSNNIGLVGLGTMTHATTNQLVSQQTFSQASSRFVRS